MCGIRSLDQGEEDRLTDAEARERHEKPVDAHAHAARRGHAVLERTNVRDLRCDDLPFRPSFVACDVSFIGLAKALPPALACAALGWRAVVLVKPQFEAGPADVGKGGVVRDPEVHRRVVDEVLARAPEWGARPVGVEPSPLLGPKGNREFFVQLADAAGGS